MKTNSKKLGSRTYSALDWGQVINNVIDSAEEVFKSGKWKGTNTEIITVPVADTEKDTTMYWIIGGAAFLMIALVAVIALKK